MGLDMFVYRTPYNTFSATKEVDFEDEVYRSHLANKSNTNTFIEIKYWRKNYSLHDWMNTLYREKGGTKDIFNSATVELTLEDLHRLEGDIRNAEFFFENVKDYLDFIKSAKEAIFDGDRVFYDSWW